MEDIYTLIHNLTTGEWQAIQAYFTCFTAHDKSKVKYLQLATDLMQAKECPSEKSICLKLYGEKENDGFRKLKFRLKEKILDFLLTDISADKQQELDEVDYAIIRMKKKSAQFQQLFYSKKRMPILYQLLDEIILLSKQYEQYSILVEHLRIKKTVIGSKNGKEEFEKINEQMNTYWDYNRMVNQAEHNYYELIVLSEYSGKPNKAKLTAFFQKATEEMQRFFETTKSPLIKYHQKFLELGFFWYYRDYSKAQSICMELLNVVRRNKSVYRRQRVGVIHDHLSRCKYYLGNFTEAVEWAREAQKRFNLNSENYCIALEQEFYALFAMKQFEQATKTAKKMLSSATRKELGEFRFSKYNFLNANTLFMQGKYSDALAILSEEREISKDKAGWEIGARLLKIMTLIEMLKLDEARLAVLSLREFLKYTDKKTPVSLRDKTILNLLLILERAGFMFSTLNGSTEKHLKALRSQDETLRWEPFTHELIPFHEWFAGKMKVKMPRPAAVQPYKPWVKGKALAR